MVLLETPVLELSSANGADHSVDPHRKVRASHLRWVAIGLLVTVSHAQREYKPAWASALAANFNIEGMGYPCVSKRGNKYHVIDGQHRVGALKLLGFADDDLIQVECYEGLTDAEESEMYLERNHVKIKDALSDFRVSVNAGRTIEVEIDACVRNQGLRIGTRESLSSPGPAPISAVTTLKNVHRRTGVEGLGKVLRIIRDAYGEAGFEALVIDALGLVVQRYDGTLDEGTMVKALSSAAGGLNGLKQLAAKAREQLGQPKTQCIAATAVNFYNRCAPARSRLAPWWKD